MKKCPNCGAVLDDSKVKCYMCGTDLLNQNMVGFGNGFNPNIGATISNNQGSMFGQGNQFTNSSSQVGSGQVSSSFFSNSSNGFYDNQLNNLNSMAYDERTALEKMFSSDDRFKSKTELIEEQAKKESQKRNNFADAFNNSVSSAIKNNQQTQQPQQRPPQQGNGPVNPNQMKQGNVPQKSGSLFKRKSSKGNPQQMKGQKNPPQPMGGPQPMQRPNQQRGPQPMPPMHNTQNIPVQNTQNIPVQNTQNIPVHNTQNIPVHNTQNIPIQNTQNIPVNNKKNKINLTRNNQSNKAPINWGNNLSNPDGSANNGGFKINPSLIFNIIALLISIGAVLFVYFKFVRKDNKVEFEKFGELKYKISDNYILKENKSNYRLYTYGEYCAIAISYGPTNAVDSFVDNLYEEVNKQLDSKEYMTNRQQVRYNNNIWEEINVIAIESNAASANGYSSQTKIQYLAVVHNGSFYKVAYQNTNNNSICSATYDSFLNTLDFN